ncbi:hypothetical protein GCU56_05155 [Geodermatophilus sabuli]|uniref:Fis family transcriptional regulator n=1 Tax=Geodermatophilus sabuli TaxID=1564158 RepID=A0A7K3VXB6_9ACTN|nr:hypothetical protein [Geodermatophilus sabuli]NEK57262.1 hypothetical protein [Geodermatophilus sabuli]
MRWEQLFADLQAEFDEAEAAAERGELGSRRRAEAGTVRLAERLGGSVGRPVRLRCGPAGEVAGVLTATGPDWVLLAGSGSRDLLVSIGAVDSVAGLSRLTAPPEAAGAVRARLDLRWALRALVRDRSAVQVVVSDGSVHVGTLDAVGADYVDLAEHDADQPRRAGAVRGVRAIALRAVAVVRTLAPGLD